MPLKRRIFHHRFLVLDALVGVWETWLESVSSLSCWGSEREGTNGKRGFHVFFRLVLLA